MFTQTPSRLTHMFTASAMLALFAKLSLHTCHKHHLPGGPSPPLPLLLVTRSWCQLLEKEGVISKFVPIDFGDADTVFDRCLQVSRWEVRLVVEGKDEFEDKGRFDRCLQLGIWEVKVVGEGKERLHVACP